MNNEKEYNYWYGIMPMILPEDDKYTGKYQVITTLLNARSKPEFDAEVIKHLCYGLEVQVNSINDGWAEITEEDPEELYYCRAEYLQKIGDGDER